MTTLRGHFDGKVIVPDEPVDLPRDQQLVINVTPAEGSEKPAHGTIEYIVERMKNSRISDEDAELMRTAIEEACERIEPAPDVNFD